MRPAIGMAYSRPRERANMVINAGLAYPKVKARLADLGVATLPGSPDDSWNLITEQTQKVAEGRSGGQHQR